MQRLSIVKPAAALAVEPVTEEPDMMFKLKPADPAATLAAFRKVMKENGVEAYIVPSEDPHMSEYPPDCCARRVYISSFTGSAGTAVITADKALLWTDGRYSAVAALGGSFPMQAHGLIVLALTMCGN